MSGNPYPWIMTRKWRWRAERRRRERVGFVDRPCARCGYDPVGFRKTCPACLVPIVEVGS